MCFTMIAIEHPFGFLGSFAGPVLVVPLNVAVDLPNVRARLVVERNRVLQVDSVECEDHEVTEQNDRRRRPAVMTAPQVVASPKHFSGRRIDAGGAVAAE